MTSMDLRDVESNRFVVEAREYEANLTYRFEEGM